MPQIGKCVCGGDLTLREPTRDGYVIKRRFVGCSNFPDCKVKYTLPKYGELAFTNRKCRYCGTYQYKQIRPHKKDKLGCLDRWCKAGLDQSVHHLGCNDVRQKPGPLPWTEDKLATLKKMEKCYHDIYGKPLPADMKRAIKHGTIGSLDIVKRRKL